MSSSDEVRGPRLLPLIVVALVGLGAALRLWNATREVTELLTTTIPDDSFYYFGIARHLTLGHPPSIDGVSPTNGYHPLWLAMLVPVWSFFGTGDDLVPVRAALVLAAVLDVGASVMLYQVCRRLGLGALASCASLFFFVVSPYAVVNGTCGLETPLALLLGLTLMHLSLSSSALAQPGRMGLLAGLALLARTDQIVLVMAIGGSLTFELWRSQGRARALSWLWRVGSTAVAVTTPWWIFSWVTTGTLVQSSGVALSLVHRNMPRVWGYEHQPWLMALDRAQASVREGGSLVVEWSGLGGVGLGLLLGMFVMLALRSREPGHEATRRLVWATAPFLGSTLVLFFAHTLVRFVFREWYTAPFIAATCLVIGVLVEQLARSARGLAIALTVIMLGTWAVLIRLDWKGIGYYQPIAGSPGTNPHEGHSDCGVVSYFTGQGITNLDGIVNQRAFEALRVGEIGDYVAKEQFTRLYLSSHFQSSVFLGPHAWERLIRVDNQAIRAATPTEKDAKIGPTTRELNIQWDEGAEYLGDGWQCCNWPPATSVGTSSELAFTTPQPGPDARLDLRLSAVVTNDAGVQPVKAILGGEVIATLAVTEEPRTFSLPLQTAKRGRNRLVLEYGAARSLPPDRKQLAWWRSDWGEPILAVRVHSLWLNVPAAVGTIDLATSDPRFECDGCYPPERSGAGEEWSWTNGHAVIRLNVGGRTGTPCRVELRTETEAITGVAFDGADAGATGTFSVELDGRPVHELVIDSKTFAAEGDARVLGLALQRVVLHCE